MARMFSVMVLLASVILWTRAASLGADTPKAIMQSTERATVQEALEKSPAFAEAVKGKSKVVASTMVRYKDKPEGATTESEFVESLHFDYDTGKTIRTIYNNSDKKVVKIETLAAYPTPLATEEIAQAKKLAEDKDEKVKALFEKYKENQVTVNALAPVISDQTNKRFGKRLVHLAFTPKEKPSDTVSVTVNLTDKTTSRE